MRPLFIVLEGIDGTGKTSAGCRIRDHLEASGEKVLMTAEPTGGDIGRMVSDHDNLSPETEALLFVADRACHTKDIKEWLSDGFTVICDRYYASTLAYQAAAGMDMDWLKALNSKVIVEPDITFLFDVDPEVSLERVGKRGEKSRFECLEYQKKVRETYLRLAKERKYVIIDASQDQEKVASDIIETIEKMEG